MISAEILLPFAMCNLFPVFQADFIVIFVVFFTSSNWLSRNRPMMTVICYSGYYRRQERVTGKWEVGRYSETALFWSIPRFRTV